MFSRKLIKKILIWTSCVLAVLFVTVFFLIELGFKPEMVYFLCFEARMKPCYLDFRSYEDENGHLPLESGPVWKVLEYSPESMTRIKKEGGHVTSFYYLTAGTDMGNKGSPKYAFIVEPADAHLMIVANTLFFMPQKANIHGVVDWGGYTLTVPRGARGLVPMIEAMRRELDLPNEIYEELLLKAKKLEAEPGKVFQE